MRPHANDSSNGRTRAKEEQVAALLESVGALESLLDVLATKVDDFDTRLGKAEVRLEEIAKISAQHD